MVMFKIVVYNVVFLDGYHTGPGNDASVIFPMMGNVFDRLMVKSISAANDFAVLAGKGARLDAHTVTPGA
jgi:hypothetical protein